MKITNQQIYAMQEITQRLDKKNSSENTDFAAALDKSIDKQKDEKNIVKSVTSSDVEIFLNKLTSMGASAFWLNFNYEKIQEKIDEKRLEFMEKLGLNKEDLEKEEKTNLIEELDKMLQDYIKELSKQASIKDELENSTSQLKRFLNI